MNERTRGYVKVAATGRARFFRPCAGRWTGGSVEVSVAAAPGWYRAVCEFTDSGPFVELGRRVDPVAEAYRLNDLGAQTSRARTRKPGVAGYQHMEDMANAAPSRPSCRGLPCSRAGRQASIGTTSSCTSGGAFG